jgi:hypothetical protein
MVEAKLWVHDALLEKHTIVGVLYYSGSASYLQARGKQKGSGNPWNSLKEKLNGSWIILQKKHSGD